MNAEQFKQTTESLGVLLSPEQLDQFQRFEDELYEFNEVMNLTRVPREESWSRHFIDSLLFQDLLPADSKVLDIGTGPGFPAWPLACARPDLKLTALDSNNKMLGFLTTMPLPNLKVVNSRAEDWKEKGKFDVVTGRAVAPLAAQLEISAAFAKVGGLVIPMRAQSDLEFLKSVNLTPLGLRLVRHIERPLPGTEVIRLFPIYEKIKPTNPGFPRRWAEIKRKPL